MVIPISSPQVIRVRNLATSNLKKISKDEILHLIFTQNVEVAENADQTYSAFINEDKVELAPIFEKLCEHRNWFGKTLTRGAVYFALNLYGIKEGPLLADPHVSFEEGYEKFKGFLKKFGIELPKEKDSLARFKRLALDYEMENLSKSKSTLVFTYHSLNSSSVSNNSYIKQFKSGSNHERLRILKELKKLPGFPSSEELIETKQIAQQDIALQKEFETYFHQKIEKEGLKDLGPLFSETRGVVQTSPLVPLIDKWILSMSPVDLMNNIYQGKFANQPVILEGLTALIPYLAHENMKFKKALIVNIARGKFGTDAQVLDGLIKSLAQINWTKDNLMADLLKAFRLGIKKPSYDMEKIMKMFNWKNTNPAM